MQLYDHAAEVSAGVRRFVNDQGTGHAMLIGELGLYGCSLPAMLVGRVMREYGHVVAKDCRLIAAVSYDTASKRIVVDPPQREG